MGCANRQRQECREYHRLGDAQTHAQRAKVGSPQGVWPAVTEVIATSGRARPSDAPRLGKRDRMAELALFDGVGAGLRGVAARFAASVQADPDRSTRFATGPARAPRRAHLPRSRAMHCASTDRGSRRIAGERGGPDPSRSASASRTALGRRPSGPRRARPRRQRSASGPGRRSRRLIVRGFIRQPPASARRRAAAPSGRAGCRATPRRRRARRAA